MDFYDYFNDVAYLYALLTLMGWGAVLFFISFFDLFEVGRKLNRIIESILSGFAIKVGTDAVSAKRTLLFLLLYNLVAPIADIGQYYVYRDNLDKMWSAGWAYGLNAALAAWFCFLCVKSIKPVQSCAYFLISVSFIALSMEAFRTEVSILSNLFYQVMYFFEGLLVVLSLGWRIDRDRINHYIDRVGSRLHGMVDGV